MKVAVLVMTGMAALLAAAEALAQDVVADSKGAVDPLGIERFPHSWIVGYRRDDSVRPREYVLGRVDKTRRDVRVEHEVRAAATREWATYEMPPGTQPLDVFDHYLVRIGDDIQFRCSGRDCGRSNHWANYIFGQAILYGPDRNQHYVAGEFGGDLVALYVIERGNKRVYAHLEVLRPENRVALTANEQLIERLTGDGLGIVENVAPNRDGALDAEELAVLERLADELSILNGQTVYVVCHLYGPVATEALLESSEGCAATAATALESTGGPLLVPFGAGPLLPRSAGANSRLELVLPHRLSQQR